MTFWLLPTLAFLLIFAAIVAFVRQPWGVKDGISHVSPSGRFQLAVFRAVVPFTVGVKKSVGIRKLPAHIATRDVPTSYGATKVTIFTPIDAGTDALPVHVNFHGGGFVIGFPEQDDLFCRHFAHRARCVVVNVDYVLAPEYPFPAAPKQGFEVVGWVRDHAVELNVDPARLTVGGSSAGAGIAAAVCLQAKEAGLPIVLQILLYGCFDFVEPLGNKNVVPGLKQVFASRALGLFTNLYLPDPATRANPLASPVYAEDVSGLPRALVLTAEHDILKTEAIRYADKLRAACVEVVARDFPGCDHAFNFLGPKDQAHDVLDLMTAELCRAFGTTLRQTG